MYKIRIERPAAKALARIPEPDYSRVGTAIQALAKNPRPSQCKKLVERPGYRIRVGDYRIIYEVYDDELLVLVVAVGHRKDIYR